MGTSRAGYRRLVPAMLAVVAASVAAPCGVANAAPVFDVDGYSACTATTPPTPDQDFDGIVTTCCVQHAGVPAPTRFGMGCVAPMDATNAALDERPTIVLPTRPGPAGDAQSTLDGLLDAAMPDQVP